ncbi:MAG: hypothetical protein UR89_C0004G0026 [Candidatus Roizmanbacteria bacterium GW2011_GWA2_35_8]|uniref:Nudix hydrolase domain-containing protein n=1 Tax=Candidatus Roizmanbacteria bacterium GW2011_GWA2_35_8 TaxID=1618479 RepID=A0A0G0G692_9BACT|nr:MAG: hypothetical protein UR89_C0004G0026 [Candidatus Roizmanbacteria bacterium GW2011_GWA2_35_8]
MKIVPVVISIIKKNNKYLITKRVVFDEEDKRFYPLVWNISGGGIEFGEAPEEALIRETREELGVELKNIIQIPKVFSEVRDHWQGLFIVFVSELLDSNAKIILNSEAGEFGWFTLNEAKKLKLMPKTIEMLEEADKI